MWACRPNGWVCAPMLSADLVPQILDSAPDAILVVDRTGTIVFANRQVSALLGYTHSQVVGSSIEQLLPERLRGQHLTHRQRYFEHARLRPMGIGLDLSARRSDGSEVPVEISLSPIEGADGPLVAAAIRDVTERRQVQLELRRAREAADAANRAKSRFLATASHDLRQPLQTLALLNGAMRRSGVAADLADALGQQDMAIDAMGRLLNALLDISKLESGAIQPTVTDFTVATLFAQLRSEFAQLAADKGLDLKVQSCDDSVQSDPSLVSQVLRNLLSNAIKYTREGWVLLRCAHEPSRVRLEVLDSGVGIPATDMAHIFEEFYQVGVPSNVAREGYGLGLAIVRRISEILGASLAVSSEPGRGSLFSIALPAGAAGGPAVSSPERPVPPARATRRLPRLLLVEDDPAVRRATQMLLRVAGYATVAVDNRSEALAQAAGDPKPEIIIADYHLEAGETGLEVIAAVRQLLGRPLKAVLVSGDTSSALRGIQTDAQLRIASKPINAEELLALLDELAGS
jgi:two-component system, sensor histidine kinase